MTRTVTNEDTNITMRLKKIIDENGPDYLISEPYKVHKELTASGERGRKVADAVLYALVRGVIAEINPEMESAKLSRKIQKDCSLNKVMADRLTEVFLSLYSEEHVQEWKNKEQEGLAQFLSEEFTCTWKGFAVWNEGNGSVDCHYNAAIVLAPTDKITENEKLTQMLKKNPFTTKDTISKYFVESICEYLDCEFEDDCTCDDYYQPVVEDFDAEYCVREWCRNNGFEFISCEGEGYDDGYEPNIRRGWY